MVEISGWILDISNELTQDFQHLLPLNCIQCIALVGSYKKKKRQNLKKQRKCRTYIPVD